MEILPCIREYKRHVCLFLLTFVLFGLLSFKANATVFFVKPTATGTGDGSSWTNASGNLQAMIDAASANDEIWVAAGTYLPMAYPTGCTNCASPRDYAFILKNQVKVYGSFVGTETSLSERTPTVIAENPSILSGDIGVNNDNSDNSYHVIISVDDDSMTVLDGFTVTHGNASHGGEITVESINIYKNKGGGMKNIFSTLTISNCSFTDNNAVYGGGMFNGECSLTINNSIFSANTATSNGGGINNDLCTSILSNCQFISNTALFGGGLWIWGRSTSITNTHFLNNEADFGGGIYNDAASTLTITKCNFSANVGNAKGGGIYNHITSPTIKQSNFYANTSAAGGGLYNFEASPNISNCSFSFNSATNGGGVMNQLGFDATFINCTFYGNNATEHGGGIYNEGGQGGSGRTMALLTNCIFWGNTKNSDPTVPGADIENLISAFSGTGINYSILQLTNNTTNYPVATSSGLRSGNGMKFAVDPLFVNANDPDGADNVLSTADDGLALQNNSPAVEEGSNVGITATADITGAPRIQNPRIDMGAYENQYIPPAPPFRRLYVKPTATGTGDGSSWANASENLQAMIDSSYLKDEVWVAAGTYKPNAYPPGCTGCTSSSSYAFMLKNQVKVYGSFAGTETSLSERTPAVIAANPSILSGDIGTINDNNDNTSHVVLSSDDDSTTVLDGFTITQANDGGMVILTSFTTITNCRFSVNKGVSGGGGMSVLDGSSPIISYCVFSSNTVSNGGGGGMFISNSASFTITHCTFKNNAAILGGAMSASSVSSLKITNCTFSDNIATGDFLGGGGIFMSSSGSDTITNCTFIRNYATGYYSSGGAINTYDDALAIKNSIFWGNKKRGFFVSNIEGQGPANVSYSDVEGGFSGINNINQDPLFVNQNDLDGADNIFGTADDGLALQNCSPAINVGNNADIPLGISTDITGAARIHNTTVDMGAYENQAGVMSVSIAVTPSATVCAGTSVTFTATPTHAGPSPFYTFKVNGTSMQNGTAATFTTTNLANSDKVAVVLTSGSCVVVSDTITMTVNALPTPTAGSNSPICAGDTLHLTSSGGVSYAWTGPNSYLSSAQNPSFSGAVPSLSGTYTVTVTAENGCSAMDSVAVTVHALPTASATNNSPVCAGSGLFLNSSGGSSYAWTGPNNFTSPTQNLGFLNSSTSLSGIYTVTVTNINGCTATASTVVAVNALPTPTAGSNSPICAGNTLHLTSSGGVSYAWTGPNNYSSSLQNPDILGASTSSSGTYSVMVTNENACTAMASVAVVVNQVAPSISANPTTVNFGNNTTLTATGCSGTIHWSAASLTTNPLTIKLDNTTTFTATCTVNGCTSIASNAVTVIVNGNPCQGQVTLVSPSNDYSTGTYQKMASATTGKITASNKINGTSQVIYTAKSIELKAGFKADNGVFFVAQVGGCH
jgi:parallel beta-helix repeat protein